MSTFVTGTALHAKGANGSFNPEGRPPLLFMRETLPWLAPTRMAAGLPFACVALAGRCR
jgi:hypothetical protein